MPGESTDHILEVKAQAETLLRQPSLVLIHPAGLSLASRFVLHSPSMTLGREEGCEIQINDRSISRRHARVVALPDGYEVLDLQSTNGTFINGMRVTRERLKDGDYLRLGECVYRFLSADNIENRYHEETRRLVLAKAVGRIKGKSAKGAKSDPKETQEIRIV